MFKTTHGSPVWVSHAFGLKFPLRRYLKQGGLSDMWRSRERQNHPGKDLCTSYASSLRLWSLLFSCWRLFACCSASLLSVALCNVTPQGVAFWSVALCNVAPWGVVFWSVALMLALCQHENPHNKKVEAILWLLNQGECMCMLWLIFLLH